MLFMDQVHIKTEIANIVSKPSVRWNNTYYSQSTDSMGNRHHQSQFYVYENGYNQFHQETEQNSAFICLYAPLIYVVTRL